MEFQLKKKRSVEKTASVTAKGHYEWLGVLFEPGMQWTKYFSTSYKQSFWNFKNTVALVYVDDVIVSSKSWRDFDLW